MHVFRCKHLVNKAQLQFRQLPVDRKTTLYAIHILFYGRGFDTSNELYVNEKVAVRN